eukprot:5828318-Pyramimonas_sp.AAC.1
MASEPFTPSSWPPRDSVPPTIGACNVSHYPTRLGQEMRHVQNIMRFRQNQKATWWALFNIFMSEIGQPFFWSHHLDQRPGRNSFVNLGFCFDRRHDKSCQRWKLGGEWSPRNRKIYYAFLVDNELALLTILLEEIYDVVDHIILQEADMSWRYQKKPKFFTKFKESHFKRYESKIRHLVYDFDLLANVSQGHCPQKSDPTIPKGGLLGNAMLDQGRAQSCPWWQQWYARNNLQTGAHDIGPDDIFIVAGSSPLPFLLSALQQTPCSESHESANPA